MKQKNKNEIFEFPYLSSTTITSLVFTSYKVRSTIMNSFNFVHLCDKHKKSTLLLIGFSKL